jgi:hypothetical protein
MAASSHVCASSMDLSLLAANASRSGLDLISKPCVRRLGAETRMPSHEIRKSFNLYLAPYFAAKAGMDALAVVYARELTRWGIETTIIVPGAFTGGTNHFAHAGSPADKARAAEYEPGPYKGFADDVLKGFAFIVPPDANVERVADAIVKVVDTPFGKRPFRVHIDPTQDGAEVVNAVSDRVRAELLRRIGLADVLTLWALTSPLQNAA